MPAEKPTSSKLVIIKVARALVYLVYAWLIIATTFLFLGWLLLLLGANPDTSFTHFVYQVAGHFLEPFRGMFPTHQISDTAYFSSAALFAIVFYSIVAFFIHALINFITMKLRKNELELEQAAREAQFASMLPPAPKPATPSTPRKPAQRQVR